MPSNYRTIMIGHYLAKLYGSWADRNGCCSAGQADFRKGFTTLDHILTLRALIEEAEPIIRGFIAAW